MYNIAILMGEAGAGKDKMLKLLLEKAPYLSGIVSCTTRPPREGEVHGVNYYYYTPEQFGDMVLHGEMLECVVFNDWFYGTSFESVRSGDVINIGIFNPSGVEALIERNDCNIIVFWIKTSDKTRLLRQLNREQNPNVREVVRRFTADYEDFENINFNFIEIKNEILEDLEQGSEEILTQIKHWSAKGKNN